MGICGAGGPLFACFEGVLEITYMFITTMTTMYLSKAIKDHSLMGNHRLNLLFVSERIWWDLRVRDSCLLLWTNYSLIAKPLSLTSRMDLFDYFAQASIGFPTCFPEDTWRNSESLLGSSVNVLVDFWNGEVTEAFDGIATEYPFPVYCLLEFIQFCEIKWHRRYIGWCYQKMKTESNQILARVQVQTYILLLQMMKR